MPTAIRRDIGQLLIGSLPGRTITPEIRSLAREFSLGGVIFFARNIEAPEQVAELSHDVQALGSELPIWVSVDQEGGRVARLKAPFTVWPPMAALGRSGDVSLAARFGKALATELRAVGITLDYAPVLDIHTNPKNPIIGDRALAEDAEGVARLGTAIIESLQRHGVAACGKHFPGHGDTSVDSHLDLPLVEHPPDRIRRVELVPFRAAIKTGVAFIMTAHVLVPSLDEERPATLSRAIVQGMLRDELGFQGVILSDDLEMKAIAKSYPVPDAAVQAIAAGCDGAARVQRGRRRAGGDARSVGPRGRAGCDSLQAARRRLEAPARGEGAVPGAPGGDQSAGPAASRARLRRTPADRGRDGPVRLNKAQGTMLNAQCSTKPSNVQCPTSGVEHWALSIEWALLG